MIDSNFRLFGLISLVDIVIIGGLIVFGFFALRFSAPQSASARPGDLPVTYTVELQRKNPDFKNKVQIGAPVLDSERGISIGTVKDVYAEPYLEDVPDYANNIIRRAPVDGLETVYVEIETMAQVTDYTTLIGTYEVLVGKEIYIKTKSFAAGGYVVRLVRGDAR